MININEMNNNNLKMYEVGKEEWVDSSDGKHTSCSFSPVSNKSKLKQIFCQIVKIC